MGTPTQSLALMFHAGGCFLQLLKTIYRKGKFLKRYPLRKDADDCSEEKYYNYLIIQFNG